MLDFNHEKEILKINNFILGIDEVGRGSFAGPVVVCGAILNIQDLSYIESNKILRDVNDSKKLSKNKRKSIFEEINNSDIKSNFFVSERTNIDIDNKGIGKCILECINEIIINSNIINRGIILIDGYFKDLENIDKILMEEKGDSKYVSIALAANYAKVYRDNLMKSYAQIYPEYFLDNNSGYGTPQHIANIRQFGISPIHRKSFLHF